MLKIDVSRKTRKQKIRAEERLAEFFAPKLQQENTTTGEYSYIKKDLLKILLFTLLAIGAQLVLWYVSRK